MVTAALRTRWRTSAHMVRRTGELPTTVQIECPGCGHSNSVSLQYSEGETADYEGVCEDDLVGGGLSRRSSSRYNTGKRRGRAVMGLESGVCAGQQEPQGLQHPSVGPCEGTGSHHQAKPTSPMGKHDTYRFYFHFPPRHDSSG